MAKKNNCALCGRFMRKDGRHKCNAASGFRQESLLDKMGDWLSGEKANLESSDQRVSKTSGSESSVQYSSMYEAMQGIMGERNVGEGEEVEYKRGGEDKNMVAGEQLPMFLSPREIVKSWAPTEGDRLYWYENGRGTPDHDETDEEFWARKLREAKGMEPRRKKFPSWPSSDNPINHPAPSREKPGFADDTPPSYPTAKHASLYEDLEDNGVETPITLEPKGKAGEEGKVKPEILGGNHRVAAMSELNPDEPIPVAFFESLKEARDSLGDKF